MNLEIERDHRCMQSLFIPSPILEDMSPGLRPDALPDSESPVSRLFPGQKLSATLPVSHSSDGV